ncbi:30S ribosomal protein S20 [Streptomyces violaceusniger Tu 4113]|uniref:Small ribosomal subunit protein bS20 n=1 Tax=Streptomyces violaceusniger (strain Tu 4113) TaxID=653045 RepID=G2P7E7_STRV4|nr:30S ribosomal protein S20 [Streptomyces violaceusniger Tu 4113]
MLSVWVSPVHGPMNGDLFRVWDAMDPAGNLADCVSCPSLTDTSMDSHGHLRGHGRTPKQAKPNEPAKAFYVANIKSQIKRNKTNEKARQRNKAVKSELKTAIRRTREAVAAGDAEKATEAARAAGRKLDKAVSKGVLHKNNAANKKSAIAQQVAGLKG